jgi:hypothetical protein
MNEQISFVEAGWRVARAILPERLSRSLMERERWLIDRYRHPSEGLAAVPGDQRITAPEALIGEVDAAYFRLEQIIKEDAKIEDWLRVHGFNPVCGSFARQFDSVFASVFGEMAPGLVHTKAGPKPRLNRKTVTPFIASLLADNPNATLESVREAARGQRSRKLVDDEYRRQREQISGQPLRRGRRRNPQPKSRN